MPTLRSKKLLEELLNNSITSATLNTRLQDAGPRSDLQFLLRNRESQSDILASTNALNIIGASANAVSICKLVPVVQASLSSNGFFDYLCGTAGGVTELINDENYQRRVANSSYGSGVLANFATGRTAVFNNSGLRQILYGNSISATALIANASFRSELLSTTARFEEAIRWPVVTQMSDNATLMDSVFADLNLRTLWFTSREIDRFWGSPVLQGFAGSPTGVGRFAAWVNSQTKVDLGATRWHVRIPFNATLISGFTFWNRGLSTAADRDNHQLRWWLNGTSAVSGTLVLNRTDGTSWAGPINNATANTELVNSGTSAALLIWDAESASLSPEFITVQERIIDDGYSNGFIKPTLTWRISGTTELFRLWQLRFTRRP